MRPASSQPPSTPSRGPRASQTLSPETRRQPLSPETRRAPATPSRRRMPPSPGAHEPPVVPRVPYRTIRNLSEVLSHEYSRDTAPSASISIGPRSDHYMRSHGYTLDSVLTMLAVHQSSRDQDHFVARIIAEVFDGRSSGYGISIAEIEYIWGLICDDMADATGELGPFVPHEDEDSEDLYE